MRNKLLPLIGVFVISLTCILPVSALDNAPPVEDTLAPAIVALDSAQKAVDKAVMAVDKATPTEAVQATSEAVQATSEATKAVGEVTKAVGEVTKVVGEVTKAVGEVTKAVDEVTKAVDEAVQAVSKAGKPTTTSTLRNWLEQAQNLIDNLDIELAVLAGHSREQVYKAYVLDGRLYIVQKHVLNEDKTDRFCEFGEPDSFFTLAGPIKDLLSPEAFDYAYNFYYSVTWEADINHDQACVAVWKLQQMGLDFQNARQLIRTFLKEGVACNYPPQFRTAIMGRYDIGAELTKFASNAREASFLAESEITVDEAKQAIETYGGEGVTAFQAILQWLKFVANRIGNNLTIIVITAPVLERIAQRPWTEGQEGENSTQSLVQNHLTDEQHSAVQELIYKRAA